VAIRAPEISRAASDFAAQPPVRAGLMGLQRRLGRSTDTILDGRDIGTVVFPDADAKIYLTASATARAERRHRELATAGHPASFETVLAEIEARDHQDMNRSVAPLRCADDAVVVDATDLDLPGAVAACVAVVEAARSRK
jgi:cytidylate kinase